MYAKCKREVLKEKASTQHAPWLFRDLANETEPQRRATNFPPCVLAAFGRPASPRQRPVGCGVHLVALVGEGERSSDCNPNNRAVPPSIAISSPRCRTHDTMVQQVGSGKQIAETMRGRASCVKGTEWAGAPWPGECKSVEKTENGPLRCSFPRESRGGAAPAAGRCGPANALFRATTGDGRATNSPPFLWLVLSCWANAPRWGGRLRCWLASPRWGGRLRCWLASPLPVLSPSRSPTTPGGKEGRGPASQLLPVLIVFVHEMKQGVLPCLVSRHQLGPVAVGHPLPLCPSPIGLSLECVLRIPFVIVPEELLGLCVGTEAFGRTAAGGQRPGGGG
jgi:hypothetical protein